MHELSFRPMVDDDVGLVAGWLREPHVQQWWKDPSAPDKVADEHRERQSGADLTEMHIVVANGRDVGIIQRYRLKDEPDWEQALAPSGLTLVDAAGIDYAIGVHDLIGRGIGAEMIAAYSDDLFAAYPDVGVIVVTPQASNRASCRVLEKAGYGLRWTGRLDSDDPGDVGPAALYTLGRTGTTPSS